MNQPRIVEHSDGEDGERKALLAAVKKIPLNEYLTANPITGRETLYRITAKLVFERVTRPVERNRGHDRCTASPEKMLPECHDAHQDDVVAVFEDVLDKSARTFENLEGWIATRLKPATIDAYRKRRGALGAPQRPRLTAWLETALGEDPWLRRLALNVLEWVGVTATVAGGIWPLGAWAQQRARMTGELFCTEAQIAADLERVLRAMRTRPGWFEDSVERPLGRKQAPLLPQRFGGPERVGEPEYVTYYTPDETAEALLTHLAWTAVRVLERRLARGDDVRETIVEVVGEVFGAGSGAEEMDRVPGSGGDARERIASLILEPEVLERVVAAVYEIFEKGGTFRSSGDAEEAA